MKLCWMKEGMNFEGGSVRRSEVLFLWLFVNEVQDLVSFFVVLLAQKKLKNVENFKKRTGMIFVKMNYIIDFDLFLVVIKLFLFSCSSFTENIRECNDFKIKKHKYFFINVN